jgi:hypothetical protein
MMTDAETPKRWPGGLWASRRNRVLLVAAVLAGIVALQVFGLLVNVRQPSQASVAIDNPPHSTVTTPTKPSLVPRTHTTKPPATKTSGSKPGGSKAPATTHPGTGTGHPVPSPVAVSANPGGKSATVNWTAAAASPKGYNVYVGLASGKERSVPANGTGLVTGTSYSVRGLNNGVTYYFTVKASTGAKLSPASNEVSSTPGANYPPVGALAAPVVSMASTPGGTGYWLVNFQGALSSHGAVKSYGSNAGVPLSAPIVQIVPTPDGNGYWEVARDGGIFTFGDAGYYGSMGGQHLNAPIVGLAATADGKGYWEVAVDGGIFAFGDAPLYGSMAGKPLATGIVGMASDPAAGGYWEVARDGGVFAFGSAQFHGSMGGKHLNAPVVGLAPSSSGNGYWLASADGGVFAFGDAQFHGSMAGKRLGAPISAITADPATGGYWEMSFDGGVFSFGAPFYGAG